MLVVKTAENTALACVQEARMENQVRDRRRNELTAALIRSVRALVDFDAKDRLEVDRLLLEAEGYITQSKSR